jgi:hypothetical protein
MSPSTRNQRLARVAAWAALLVPAYLMLWSARDMWLVYSPMPYVDQWLDIREWRDHGWLRYLTAQYLDHRIFFPRLVFLADWKLFQGRDVLNLTVIGLIQLAGAAFFVTAAQVRKLAPLGFLALAVALALIFCLIQWENLFWGFQVQFVGVYAAGAWAIWLFCRAGDRAEGVRWASMAGALALLTVATFSMANGVLAGAAMAAVGLAAGRRWAATLTVAAATVVLLAAFLHGYQWVHETSPTSALQRPDRVLAYICTYVGAIWWPLDAAKAAWAGAVGLALSAGMLFVVVRKGARDSARLSLLGVVLFVGLSAAMTGLGRLSLGVEQSMASRYMTPTAYFWASHALFWALTFQHGPSPLLRHGVCLMLIVLLVRILTLQPIGEQRMMDARDGSLVGASALLGGIDDKDALSNTMLPAISILDIAPFARARHIALFADPPVATVGAPFARPVVKDTLSVCLGAFDTLGPARGGSAWRAMGWGWDRKARRELSRIVLVDGSGTVLGIGVGGGRRLDVKKAVHAVKRATSGWAAALTPGSGGEVIAYGVTMAGSACELGRKTRLQ